MYDPAIIPTNMTTIPGKNYEFGIGLDYTGAIFHIMKNSKDDIHFISFNHPSVIASPSKLSGNAFTEPIHLPLDLNLTAPPFAQHVVSTIIPNPPIVPELDNIPKHKIEWDDIDLATNVIVPGSSVPASLNFHGNEKLMNEWWTKMWYQKYSRALLRQYLRSPDGPIAAQAAADGGDKWWDLRGGKGGVWTDKGEWLELSEVCGGFEEEVFADGKGRFGKEEVAGFKAGPVYNKFGILVEGKEDPEQIAADERKAAEEKATEEQRKADEEKKSQEDREAEEAKKVEEAKQAEEAQKAKAEEEIKAQAPAQGQTAEEQRLGELKVVEESEHKEELRKNDVETITEEGQVGDSNSLEGGL